MSREAMKRRVERIEAALDHRQSPLVIMLSPIIDSDGSEIYADTYVCDVLPGMTVTRQPGEGDKALLERAEAEFIEASRGKSLSLVIHPERDFLSQ